MSAGVVVGTNMLPMYYINTEPSEGLFDDIDDLMSAYKETDIVHVKKVTREESLYAVVLDGKVHAYRTLKEADEMVNTATDYDDDEGEAT